MSRATTRGTEPAGFVEPLAADDPRLPQNDSQPGHGKFAEETEYLRSIGTCPDAGQIALPLVVAILALDDLHERISALEFPSSFSDEKSQPWRVEARRTVIEVRRAIDMVCSTTRATCYASSGDPDRVGVAMRYVLESLTGVANLAQQVDFDEAFALTNATT